MMGSAGLTSAAGGSAWLPGLHGKRGREGSSGYSCEAVLCFLLNRSLGRWVLLMPFEMSNLL